VRAARPAAPPPPGPCCSPTPWDVPDRRAPSPPAPEAGGTPRAPAVPRTYFRTRPVCVLCGDITMSKRNSQAAKTAARERLRQERERQAKKAKAKRQLVVALSVVGVLAAAGGIGYAVVQANKPSAWEAAKNAELVKPANSTGKNGTTVVIGKPEAKKTLELYED